MRVATGEKVSAGAPLTEGSVSPHDILRFRGQAAVQDHLVQEIQGMYRLEGAEIDDKHIEIIVRQMLRRARVEKPGDTGFLPEEIVDVFALEDENARARAQAKEPATATPTLLGITKASLAAASFLSAASFQHTAQVLADAAIKGRIDPLRGLKESVITGKMIPAGTGISPVPPDRRR